MTRGTLLIASAIAILVSTHAAEAKSIKSQVPRAALVAFCNQVGLGEKTASFTLPDGTVISGTIHCEAEDITTADPNGTGAVDDHGQRAQQPGDDHGQNAEPGDDHGGHGNDDGANHDANDDGGHHGNDDGANHDANDDGGHHGNDDGANHDANDDGGHHGGNDD